jgi:cytochrome bd-type quinol oxidase subunit 2
LFVIAALSSSAAAFEVFAIGIRQIFPFVLRVGVQEHDAIRDSIAVHNASASTLSLV